MPRIIGLDLSLTGTGIATVDTDLVTQAVTVEKVGSKAPARAKGAPPPSLPQRSARLRALAGQITQRCVGASLVVIEGPAYSKSDAGTWDRAGLWWMVVGRLTGAGLNVVEADPTALKTYSLGKGGGAGTDKDAVLAAVIRRYITVVEVSGNNEADALILAAMGSRFAGHPIEPGGMIPATHAKALDRVRWTPDR